MKARAERLRFDAARWLVTQFEKREELEHRQRMPAGDGAPVSREAILQELRGLNVTLCR
jgi:hypothetical protein